MKIIIIEGDIYKVSEKEYKKIKALEDEANLCATQNHVIYFKAEDNLYDYLDQNRQKYKHIGTGHLCINSSLYSYIYARNNYITSC